MRELFVHAYRYLGVALIRSFELVVLCIMAHEFQNSEKDNWVSFTGSVQGIDVLSSTYDL